MSDFTPFPLPAYDAIPFDDFKVQGVIRRRFNIPVDDANAEYWTVIGYMSGKQICGIGRFKSRTEAEEFCGGLVRHPRPTDA